MRKVIEVRGNASEVPLRRHGHHHLTVTFYPDSIISNNNTLSPSAHDYTDTELKVLELIKKSPNITQKDIAAQLKASRSTVQRIIKGLSSSGLIERVGSKSHGEWTIN